MMSIWQLYHSVKCRQHKWRVDNREKTRAYARDYSFAKRNGYDSKLSGKMRDNARKSIDVRALWNKVRVSDGLAPVDFDATTNKSI